MTKRTHNRREISLLLDLLPESSPSTEPCHEVNYFLWKTWCAINDRHTSPSVWTEADVTYSSVLIIARHLRETMADDK